MRGPRDSMSTPRWAFRPASIATVTCSTVSWRSSRLSFPARASAFARSSDASRTSAPSFAWASILARSSFMLSWRVAAVRCCRCSSRMSSMTFLYSIASTNRRSRIASIAFPSTSSARGDVRPSFFAASISRPAVATRSFAAPSTPAPPPSRGDEILRGGLQPHGEAVRHVPDLVELPEDLLVAARLEGGLGPLHGPARVHDRDVGAAEVRDDLLESRDLGSGGLHDRPRLLLPGVLHLREGLLDPLLRRAGVLDGVVEVPVLEMQLRLREGRPGLVHVDPRGPRIVDPPVRAVDQGPRGRREFRHELLRRGIEVREDLVDLLVRLLLEGALARLEGLLGPGDLDVRLPQVLDEPLDRDEPARGGPGPPDSKRTRLNSSHG